MRRRPPRSAALTLALLMPACAANAQERAAVVMTGDLRFGPAVIEVPVGGTVTWQNDGVTRHTATAVDRDREPTGQFDSGVVVGTGAYSHQFADAGTYTYACTIHGGEMVGVVAVGQ